MGKTAFLEGIAAAAGDAAALAPVIFGAKARDQPPRRRSQHPVDAVDDQPVLTMMMGMDVPNHLIGEIVGEDEAAGRDLVAGVAIGTADDEPRKVAVQLDVGNVDG